ncbi:MAG: pyrroline-5-carboxylate reductase [Chloroflexi bacterium]|nr:pyrroline-5-carboxylate reductase [Chloroflexota bacterium]
MRVAFIGGGVMAEAMLSGALRSGVFSAAEVRIGEPVEERRRHLEQQYGVSATPSNEEATQGAELIILSVKPQNLEKAMADLRGKVNESQAVLSIVAGARIETLSRGMSHSNIIRVMPNTPAQVGAGMSVWTASPSTTEEQRQVVERLLGSLGEGLCVPEEKYIDMATALSASGPAYVLSFIEALVDAGVYIGMPGDMARRLVLQTVLGSSVLVKKTGRHPADLRNMVTSPGGTTAEALLELEQGAFRGTVMKAVIAAYRKSRQLGEKA